MIKARNLRKSTVVSTYFFKSSRKTPFFNQRTSDRSNLSEFNLDDDLMETEHSNSLLQPTTNVTVEKFALDDERICKQNPTKVFFYLTKHYVFLVCYGSVRSCCKVKMKITHSQKIQSCRSIDFKTVFTVERNLFV